MDIVVCIPKERLPDILKEEDAVKQALAQGGSPQYFWSLGRKPRHLNVGDRCFFAWDGAVRAHHTVIGFGTDMKCDTTQRIYHGFALILDPHIVSVEPPLPVKSFRGFQYWPLTQH